MEKEIDHKKDEVHCCRCESVCTSIMCVCATMCVCVYVCVHLDHVCVCVCLCAFVNQNTNLKPTLKSLLSERRSGIMWFVVPTQRDVIQKSAHECGGSGVGQGARTHDSQVRWG